jgi:hypothetical protein
MNKQDSDPVMPSLSKKTKKSSDSVEAIASRYLCGDLDIRIDRNGLWFYHGSPIGRKELVRLFASVLQRDDEGRYWLITPAEKGEIQVEDAPFSAVEMMCEGEGAQHIIRFRTNVDDIVNVDRDHPIRVEIDPETGEPSPYVMVRDGLEARLTRSVFYELVEIGLDQSAEDAQILRIWSNGISFPIGNLSDNN